jgi:RimJ/RimL family protein N-acetyltransferase
VTAGALETSRLRLDRWGEEHTEMLVRLAALPEVMRYVGPGALLTREQAEEMAARVRRHWSEHGFGWRPASDKATGELVGFIALNFAGEGTVGLGAGEYEIGWWLAPEAWGRGLAREGAEALRDEAFGVLGAPSIVARIQPANARSIAVAEACGLTHDFDTTGKTGEPVAVYRLLACRDPLRLGAGSG